MSTFPHRFLLYTVDSDPGLKDLYSGNIFTSGVEGVKKVTRAGVMKKWVLVKRAMLFYGSKTILSEVPK